MATNEADVIEQQRLAIGHVPEVEGPLVDVKRPTEDLRTKYAEADEIYKVKLGNLVVNRPWYRPMKGDGSCGWRAIYFGYYESLVLLKDPDKITEERSRISAFQKIISYEQYIYEEWMDAALNLLDEVRQAIISGGDSNALLEKAFNDEETSLSLIQWLRTITSSWMKMHPEGYAPYLEAGDTMEQYCQTRVEPYVAELEELSLKAAYDVLIASTGIGIDISYLDLSPGEMVNSIRYQPPEAFTMIGLLYRPGHYDILYPETGQIACE